MLNANEIQAGLGNFYGTEGYHRVTVCPGLVATDGVAWLAQNAGCFWLIDEIALANRFNAKVRAEEMQFWTLKVTGNSAVLTCDHDENQPIFRKKIEFTDFPLPGIRIWVAFGDETAKVAMLPSEY